MVSPYETPNNTEAEGEERTKVQELAETIMQQDTFVATTDNGQLYWFNGKIYIPDQEWIIKKKCRLLLSEITSHDIQEVINYIRDLNYIDRSQFDSDPNLLVVENGILNIHTLELTAHRPDHYALSYLPVWYDKEATCPRFRIFLKDTLRQKDIKTMLKFIGYCLYKSAKFEKATLLVGKGDNGKSTLLNALGKFFGSQNVSHVSLQDLSGGNRFAAVDLYGKMINTFADLRKDKLPDTGPFKMLTSGDWIRAEHKYVRAFSFQNHAKLCFSCNSIPESNDQGYAYYKRWIIFHFERSFTGEERDNTLIYKLTTPEEQSGLLNLALLSLRKLIADNGFTDIDDIETVQKDYELNSNTVRNFIDQKCEITKDIEDYIICRDLYDEYIKYCNANEGMTAKSDNIFGSEIHQLKNINIKKGRKMINRYQEYVYFGIKLKESA